MRSQGTRASLARRGITALAGLAVVAGTLIGVAAPATAEMTSASISPDYVMPGTASDFTVTMVANGTSTISGITVSPEWDWTVSYGARTSDTISSQNSTTITCNNSGIVFTAVGGTWTTPATNCTYTDGGIWDPANHIVAPAGAVASSGTTSITTYFPSGVVTVLQSVRGYGIWTIDTAGATEVQMRVATKLPVAADAPVDTIDIDGNGGSCTPNKFEGYHTTWTQLILQTCTAPQTSQGYMALTGFATSPNPGPNDVYVQPGGWLYFGGSNRLYAQWVEPKTAGAPTNVVATSKWHAVSLSYAAPVDTGSYPITNYLSQATPSGQVCITRLNLQGESLLTCEFTSLTPGTKYTFATQALNGSGWGPKSVASNAATPQDIAITGYGRKKLNFFLGGGSKLSVSGVAPGYAKGTKLNVWMSLANGPAVQLKNVTVTPDSDGKYTLELKRSKDDNKKAIGIYLTDPAGNKSRAIAMGPVK